MKTYTLSHLSDLTLLTNLSTLVARDRVTTAEMLAHIAEVDARKLYLPAGYSSMYAYCVGEFGMSEDSACKRIRAARTARQFPVIFDAVADGRLNLTSVVLLAPHMSPETANALLAEASHKKNSEIELLLAKRFPRPDVPEILLPVRPETSLVQQLKSPAVELPSIKPPSEPLVTTSTELSAARRIEPPDPRPRMAPLAPQRYALQVTLSQNAHDMLREVQALLGHQVPSGNLSEILERVIIIARTQLQKQKFAATERPRPGLPRPVGRRTIPAHVKRAVWKRDEGQCSFVSDRGHRCEARGRLEYDHVLEVAHGGQATAKNLRLRCRAHNQYAAECAFGTEFMNRKRQEARAASSGFALEAL